MCGFIAQNELVTLSKRGAGRVTSPAAAGSDSLLHVYCLHARSLDQGKPCRGVAQSSAACMMDQFYSHCQWPAATQIPTLFMHFWLRTVFTVLLVPYEKSLRKLAALRRRSHGAEERARRRRELARSETTRFFPWPYRRDGEERRGQEEGNIHVTVTRRPTMR